MVKRLSPVPTSNGAVIGFADTYGLRDQSSALFEAADAEGGETPVWKWLGIPYAQAGRWKRPVEPVRWRDGREALEFGTMFPQQIGFSRFWKQKGWINRNWVKMSKDSHTVNVFAPPDVKPGENLPVMVWIYGGSLNNGSADRMFYDATEWVRRSAEEGKRFIVVTGNYRVNIFGFFSTPDLLNEDPQGLAGNYGLYDVVFMLEWVQQNITNFGGSPANVTVFGESAGSFLISHLLVSGRKLFKRAIMQSGAPDTMKLLSSSSSYPNHSVITSSLIPSRATPKARLEGLRSLPFTELLALHESNKHPNGVCLTLEDGPNATWTEDSLDRMKRGEWDDWIEEVIIGTNEDEGSYFVASSNFGSPDLFNHFVSRHPLSLQPSIIAKYGSLPSADVKTAPVSRLLADSLFDTPALTFATALSAVRNVKTGKQLKVYLYRIRAAVDRLSKEPDPLVDTGSMHVVEIPLIFNCKTLWSPGSHEEAASKSLGSLWSNFAVSGIPTPEWKSFTLDAPSWLAIDDWGKTENEDLTGWEKDRIDFSGRGFCLPQV